MPTDMHRITRPDRRIILLLTLLAAVPPLFASNYALSVGVVIGLTALVTTGLNLLMGHAGQVSLGQAAFYGLGAYGSAILSVKTGLNPWAALLVAVVLAALVAYGIGFFTLRLSGHFLALATLAFGIIVYILFSEMVQLTGGPSGLVGIPSLKVGGLSLASDRSFYMIVWAAVLVGLVVYQNVVASRTGLALRAIHGSEYAAATLGVPVWKAKLQVFVLSAVYAAVAGSLYGHFVGFISPSSFSFQASIEFLVAGVIGGLVSVGGPVVGSVVVAVLSQGLKALLPVLLPGVPGEVEIMVYGLVLILILILMPEGIAGRIEKYLQRVRQSGAQRRAA